MSVSIGVDILHFLILLKWGTQFMIWRTNVYIHLSDHTQKVWATGTVQISITLCIVHVSIHPHSFFQVPIHENPHDSESKIVAIAGGGFAWDFALRFLLPDNVEGIIVEIQNFATRLVCFAAQQCGRYHGRNTKFLQSNQLVRIDWIWCILPWWKCNKRIKVWQCGDCQEVVRDLSLQTHPNFTTTPGHCQYSIVSKLFLVYCFF